MPSHNPNPKIIRPKGERYPGSGRVKGTPNRVAVQARVLVGELVNSAEYQRRLRRDFELRRVHPTIESLVWAYHLGRPKQDIQIAGQIDISARIEEERRAFLSLDLADLEELAADSQRLVDRALALAKRRDDGPTPQDVAVAHDLPIVSGELLGNCSGSDNTSSVNHELDSDTKPETPTGQ